MEGVLFTLVETPCCELTSINTTRSSHYPFETKRDNLRVEEGESISVYWFNITTNATDFAHPAAWVTISGLGNA